MPTPDSTPRRPIRQPQRDGHFPTHSVTVADPGKPYSNYYTVVGTFDNDADAIRGALADFPFKDVRVTKRDGNVIYDSKDMKGKL